jgi:Na+-transporting NADH:ubiquinone oxidoreductase subunit NqrF
MEATILAFAKEKLPEFDYAVGDFDYGGDGCKWYEHDRDMEQLSAEFPTVTFTLTGDGEESLDNWEKHYKAGQIIYESCVQGDLSNYTTLLDLVNKLVVEPIGSTSSSNLLNVLKEQLVRWKRFETNVS